MSMRYRGSIMWATLPTVTTSSASGAWTLTQQMQYQAAGSWPSQPLPTWTNSAAGGSGYTTSTFTTKIVQDNDGNSYWVGYGSYGYNRGTVAKFDISGTKLWEKYYSVYVDYSSSGGFFDAVFDPSGNVVLAFTSYIQYRPIVGIVKINTSGAVLASRYYDFNGGTYNGSVGMGLTVDASGNVYLVGMGIVSNQYRGFLLKISGSDLSVIWARGTAIYVGNYYGDWGYAVAVSPDGNTVYTTGTAYGSSSGTKAGYIGYWAASSGSLLGTKTLSISGQSSWFGAGLAVDPSGNLYVGGTTSSNKRFFSKLNSSLVPQWGISVDTTSISATGAPIFYTSNGDVYFGGTFGSYNNCVIKASASTGSVSYTRNLASYDMFGVNSSGDILYLGDTESNAGSRQFQRMLGTGAGTGLYSYSTSYYNYGFGPTTSSVTVTATTVSQTSFEISPNVSSGWTASSGDATSSTFTLGSIPTTSGSALYNIPGSYTWIAPTGVTSVSALCIGGGGGGSAGPSGNGGGGGALAYKNSITVVPGSSYTVVVGSGGTGGVSGGASATNGTQSYFNTTSEINANGGVSGSNGNSGGTASGTGVTGYSGGQGGYGSASGAGGGGAGGYAGAGGSGGGGSGSTVQTLGNNGTGGSGAGGNGGFRSGSTTPGDTLTYSGGSSGTNVGIGGQGTSGNSAAATNGSPTGTLNYGGGGAGGGYTVYNINTCCETVSYDSGGSGWGGAVRVLWGAGRSFPSTNVGAP